MYCLITSSELSYATIVWTTGTATNPLIATLPIAEANRNRQGRLKVLDTLQLPDFPEVFVGGDCTVMANPLPTTAQVAYQQGPAIAHNLKALSEDCVPVPVQISLRGTLMK